VIADTATKQLLFPLNLKSFRALFTNFFHNLNIAYV
jgi:hypothetical protein